MTREGWLIIFIVLLVSFYSAEKFGEHTGQQREIARINKLFYQLEKDVEEAKKITSDPCSSIRFMVVSEPGLNDKRFILEGQDMTLSKWSPTTYRWKWKTDHTEFYLSYVLDSVVNIKLTEQYDPDSKFCQDRASQNHMRTKF